MPKSVKEVRWPDLSERTIERKQFEADDQDNENEQAGAFQRNFFPCEQEQRQHGQQKNRQCMYIWNVWKAHSHPADSLQSNAIYEVLLCPGSQPDVAVLEAGFAAEKRAQTGHGKYFGSTFGAARVIIYYDALIADRFREQTNKSSALLSTRYAYQIFAQFFNEPYGTGD